MTKLLFVTTFVGTIALMVLILKRVSMKRFLLIVMFSGTMALLLSMGCATKQLWEDGHDKTQYDEKIDGFFVTQDNRTIFLGQKYHYIFDTNNEMSFLLSHRAEKGIGFNIPSGNYTVFVEKANASFSVSIDLSNVSQGVREWLGQYKQKTKEGNGYKVHLYINGNRYTADSKVNERAKKFDQPIVLKVKEEQVHKDNAGQTIGKVIMTPLAIAADGALVVVGAAVVVVAIPIGIIGQLGH